MKIPDKENRKRVDGKLTHRQLCLLGARYLHNNCKIEHVLVEVGYRAENPDVFGFGKYQSVLIECKASRSDFLADKKKPFRQNQEQGIGEIRIYLCNKGVATQEEIPKGWRLLVAVDENTIDFPFHFNLFMYDDKFRIRNATSEIALMYSWLYRKEHNCLPVIPIDEVNCQSTAEEEAKIFLKERGQWEYWEKYYGEKQVIENLRYAIKDKLPIPRNFYEKYKDKLEEIE